MSRDYKKVLEIQTKFEEHSFNDIPVGSIWKHYKGGLYKITGFAMQESTEKMYVCYESVDRPLKFPWIRPASEFFDTMWDNESMKRRFIRVEQELPPPKDI